LRFFPHVFMIPLWFLLEVATINFFSLRKVSQYASPLKPFQPSSPPQDPFAITQ